MANKIIGGESFVVTVGNNEADFAESDKKQGRLMRVPPNLKPNPSQINNSKDIEDENQISEKLLNKPIL